MDKALKDWTLAEVLAHCESHDGCPRDCLFYEVCGGSLVMLDTLDGWDAAEE